MEQTDRLTLLKNILLDEEKETASDLLQKIKDIEQLINDEEKFNQRVEPVIDSRIDSFTKEFPQKFSPLVTDALKKEMQNSQDAVVEALFPIIGKMIKKYIRHEIQLLNERVNRQLSETFSFKKWFSSKTKRQAVAHSAILRTEKPELLQVLVVEKNSGILKASFTNSEFEAVDEDMVAGMLTAIKSFVEDAFNGGNQNLETIDYEFYTLHIQNFHKYYITAVINGTYASETKDKLEDLLLDFAENGVSKDALHDNKILTNELKFFFNGKSI